MKVVKEKKTLKYYIFPTTIASIIIIGFSLAILNLSGDVDQLKKIFSLKLILFFYFFSLLTSLLNCCIWSKLNHLVGAEKKFSDALVDSALMSLGKYVPGKIWGAVVRGRSGSSLTKIEPGILFLSFVEIAYSLIVGLVVAACFFLIYYFEANVFYATITIVIAISILIFLFRIVWKIILKFGNKYVDGKEVSLVDHLVVTSAYFLLWILTTIPFYLVLTFTNAEFVSHYLEITVSFIMSIIVGWLAIFAPAGIGVREAVFTVMSQGILKWQDAFTFITVHRILLTSFDVIYGFIGILTLAIRSKIK